MSLDQDILELLATVVQDLFPGKVHQQLNGQRRQIFLIGLIRIFLTVKVTRKAKDGLHNHTSLLCILQSRNHCIGHPHPQRPQKLQHFLSEPILVPKSSFNSFPSPGGQSQQSSPCSHLHLRNLSSLAAGPKSPYFTAVLSSLSNSNMHLPDLPHELHYGGNMSQLNTTGLSLHDRLQNRWTNHAGLIHGDYSSLMNSILPRHFPHQNGLLSPQIMSPQQQRLHLAVQPTLGHFSAVQSQLFNSFPSPSHLSKHGSADYRNPRSKSSHKGRQSAHSSKQATDGGNEKTQFRSKYMTGDEIQSIMKIQHAATRGNDPYVDDYYHQARLTKKSAETRSTRRFCPNKEQSSRLRNSTEMQPHLHVDAQGRVSFSSIRRPRLLLEFDPPGLLSSDGSGEQKVSEKPLEQEPTLAARITIEDGFYLLLEVDDIERLLRFSQPQDGGAKLRRKRKILLEGMTALLELVDPLGKGGSSIGLTPKDDIVFLWLVSLPKGQKLISRYLQHLIPGVAGCISGMDLNSLSACLAAIVCSSEQPPLRPLGSPAGDGAFIILKSLLERETHLLTNPQAGGSFSIPNRALWQASFDAFFGLLTKYCLSKYDSIMQSILVQTPSNTEVIVPEAARAISGEMPVELLCASLPHTNEQQRKLLFNFARRSMPVTGVDAHGGCSGQTNLEPVSCYLSF